jgi:hypothetical protein
MPKLSSVVLYALRVVRVGCVTEQLPRNIGGGE